MLKIAVVSDNIYYRKGLETLIMNASHAAREGVVSILSERKGAATEEADIVFRDIMISIFSGENKREKIDGKGRVENCLSALHIPFICRVIIFHRLRGK